MIFSLASSGVSFTAVSFASVYTCRVPDPTVAESEFASVNTRK